MSDNPATPVYSSLLSSAGRRVAAIAIAAGIAAGAVGLHSWLDEREQRIQLAATIASQNSLIAAAAKREQDRAQQLADTLKQIADLKASVQTPRQVIRELPQYLPPLPQPLETIAPAAAASTGSAPDAHPGPAAQQGTGATGGATGSTTAQLPSAPDVRVPSADLKPLFDYVQDCRACQAKLAAAQQDADDERKKNAALTTERDAAVKVAKGGTVWSRTFRVVKWVAIGFGIGYVAHAATH